MPRRISRLWQAVWWDGLSCLALVCVLVYAAGCIGAPDPWASNIEGRLYGSQYGECSDPVYGQLGAPCCAHHDACFERGGTLQDFHLCNAEFLSCQLVWDIPPDIAEARWLGVREFGLPHFELKDQRTRGPD